MSYSCYGFVGTCTCDLPKHAFFPSMLVDLKPHVRLTLLVVAGMLVYTAPALACKLFFAAKTTYDPLTLGSYRFIGTQVIYVALFYIAGGRSRSPQIIAATIVGHGWLLPPLILLAGYKYHFDLGLACVFASTDFLFGNLAWYVYSEDLKLAPAKQSS